MQGQMGHPGGTCRNSALPARLACRQRRGLFRLLHRPAAAAHQRNQHCQHFGSHAGAAKPVDLNARAATIGAWRVAAQPIALLDIRKSEWSATWVLPRTAARSPNPDPLRTRPGTLQLPPLS